MIDRFLAEARTLLRGQPVAGAGVSIGGPLNSRAGIIYSPPHLPGWDAVPLKEILERELKLPVNIEHDAAACAFAEYLWGAGRGSQNMAYLTCGTGFGAGFVFNGKIHRGANGGSCEVGHITLRNEGPVLFGKRGSAEAWCSGTALTLLAAWKFPERWGQSPPGGRELGQLAAQGDAGAGEIIRFNAVAVGEVCALLTDTLGLDRILLGSLARYLGRPWLEEARRSFERHVLPAMGRQCRIEAAGLGDRLQDCSALAAAVSGAQP
jgi:glucokinase